METPDWHLRPRGIYRDVLDRRLDETEALAPAQLERATVPDGRGLTFRSPESRDKALEDGVFVLEIPEGFELAAGDRFAEGFYRGPQAPPYGRFRELTADTFGDPLLGFHERINQIEQFLLERRFWSSHYPAEIRRVGEALTDLSTRILRSILDWIEIPPAQWERATGGCSSRAGSYHLTFNHYRPDFGGVGLSSHKDDGFLTILRTRQAGLEVNRRGRWERIVVDDDCFVINFGLSMEILTRRSVRPIAAILHRVAHQAEHRVSYGHFTSSACEPGASAGIYSYGPESGLRQVCESRELINANDEEIYLGTESGDER